MIIVPSFTRAGGFSFTQKCRCNPSPAPEEAVEFLGADTEFFVEAVSAPNDDDFVEALNAPNNETFAEALTAPNDNNAVEALTPVITN